MTSPKVDTITFSNGKKLPLIGLGTWKSKPNEVTQAVKDAIDIGYRHFDCAFIYGNEKEVGDAITEKMKEGTIHREDIFITTKIWNTFHSKERARKCVKLSLANLGMAYIDLLLIHWPMGYQEGDDLFPKNEKGDVLLSDVDYLTTWEALEQCQKDGLVRYIGLSNFNSQQIQSVLDASHIKPCMLQVECHPYLNQQKLLEFCRKNNITMTAYSCLGSPDRPVFQETDPVLLDDPTLKAIAEKHKRTPAQICLRFQVERGVIAIPKSVTKSRLLSNFEVLDFSLSEEDMKQLNEVNRDARLISLESLKGHPYYPFSIPF